MKKLLIVFCSLWALCGLSFAEWNGSPPGFGGKLKAVASATYVGPGNLVSFSHWYGLRAYSAATTGTAAIDLRRASDSATCTGVATLANGNLDISIGTSYCTGSVTVTSFCNATTCLITKLYDQAGGGSPLTNSTGSNEPTLLFATLGTKPVIYFDDPNNTVINNLTGYGVIAEPFTISMVYEAVTSFSFARVFTDVSAGEGIISRTAGNITMQTSDGGFQNIPAADGSFWTFNGNYNGASSRYVLSGGSPTTAAGVGITAFTGAVTLGHNAGTNNEMYISEIGFSSTGFSDANLSAVDTNQRTFYGL